MVEHLALRRKIISPPLRFRQHHRSGECKSWKVGGRTVEFCLQGPTQPRQMISRQLQLPASGLHKTASQQSVMGEGEVYRSLPLHAELSGRDSHGLQLCPTVSLPGSSSKHTVLTGSWLKPVAHQKKKKGMNMGKRLVGEKRGQQGDRETREGEGKPSTLYRCIKE